MKLSYNWLCDYVDLSGLSPEAVAEKLTMGAFEVEEVERLGPDLVGPVVVGEIVEIARHPNADKIRCTKVKIKSDAEPVEIVCGAQNIEVGQRIPVALPGAVVLNRKTGEKLPIKASAIRGVHSNGMLCSPPELGITDGDSEGILVLSRPGENGLELGIDLIEHLALRPDYILHVAPRSNRGDALSVIGLAREVAALTGRQLKLPEWQLHEGDENAGSHFSTGIEALPDDCPYFSVRIIENLKIGPSPDWLKRRLEALGLRCVNNVVDITNYVMLEFGQPLHAYDMARLKGNILTVRRARAGEKIVSIDAKSRQLNDEVLVIADGQDVVGIAGIMGGKDSEISDETTSIALEAACFNSKRVRRGSRILGLSSDSSLRFERGVDLQTVKTASDRAAYLLAKYGGHDVKVGKFHHSGTADLQPLVVSVRLSQIKRFLDLDMDSQQAASFLSSLGFAVKCKDDRQVSVEVPSFRRADVSREIDLIEEICRLHGYDNLREAMPSAAICPPPRDNLLQEVRHSLAGQGLTEAWISSLRGESEFGDLDSPSLVKVLNPLSNDHQVLRQSLLPGLIGAVNYNQDHGNKEVWLFETGRIYKRLPEEGQPNNGSSHFDLHGTGVIEHLLVAGVISGSQIKQVTQSHKENGTVTSQTAMQESVDFYRVKGIVENLLEQCGLPLDRVRFYRPEAAPEIFHPYRVAQIAIAPRRSQPRRSQPRRSQSQPDAADKSEKLVKLGFLGELHPFLLQDKQLRQQAFAFELDLDLVAKCRVKKGFVELATTPSLARDLTVDLSAAIDQASVQSLIEVQAGESLVDLELVSIFQLDEEHRSLSYRLTFQDKNKTLTNEEIDERLSSIRKALSEKMAARFRA